VKFIYEKGMLRVSKKELLTWNANVLLVTHYSLRKMGIFIMVNKTIAV